MKDSDSSFVDDSDESLSSSEARPDTSPPTKASSSHLVKEPMLQAQAQAQTTSPTILPRISTLTEDVLAHGDDATTYLKRPNRYLGPASTWRSWTEEERAVALSLDRVRAQDLSIHLFNAFGLKRKARGSAAEKGRTVKKSKKGKERAKPEDDGEVEDEAESEKTSTLPKSWTAWPMPPDEVPRDGLLPGSAGDYGTTSMKDDQPPSANLQEWLLATAARIAREKWLAREWEEEHPVQRSMMADHGDTEDHAAESQNADLDHVTPREEAEEGNASPVFYSQRPSSLQDENDSNSNDDGHVALKREHGMEELNMARRPVPVADDDQVRQYFQPSARHILAKFDDLLLGLHKARYAYAARSHPQARGTSGSQTPESKSQSRSRGRSLSRGRRSSSVNTNVSSASARSGKRQTRVERLGLRDWSDVIGMASLTGWDPAVVERAGERCAKLFVENMLFRTLYEGAGKEGYAPYFEEHLAIDTDSPLASPESEAEDEGSDEDEVVLVIRTSRPCIGCREAKSLCEPADHDTGISRACRRCEESGNDCSGISVQLNTREGRVCPHRRCPRNSRPFKKNWHLQRHLNTNHSNESLEHSRGRSIGSRSKSRSRGVSAATTSGPGTDFEGEPATGGFDPDQGPSYNWPSVHDEMLCPVTGCPRKRQGFQQAKRLFDHIRRMHPEIDIQAVKKRVSQKRIENRGRWRDKRRHASRSKSQSQSKSRSRVRGNSVADEGD